MASEQLPLRRTILLTGDFICHRLPLGDVLRSAGHTVLTTNRGMEACEIVDREGSSLGLIILNLSQPDLGWERVLQALMVKRVPERIPVWAIVNPFEKGSASQRDALTALGVTDFLDRFTSPEEILAKVNGAFYAERERRRNPRISVYLPAEGISPERKILGHLTFLSREGAFFQAAENLSRDRLFQIRFALPGIPRLLSAQARVLYSVEKRPTDPVFLMGGMGVFFDELDGKHREMIESFIQEKIASDRGLEAP